MADEIMEEAEKEAISSYSHLPLSQHKVLKVMRVLDGGTIHGWCAEHLAVAFSAEPGVEIMQKALADFQAAKALAAAPKQVNGNGNKRNNRK